jgi:dolichol-phosphate mannosyltransferase
LNAAIQAVVPPPKYAVTDLVDCEMGRRTRLEHVFLIERGSQTEIGQVTGSEAVEALIRNTEDAYGFPPYPSLARHICIDGMGHAGLRRRERAILESALGDRDLTRIVAADYGWADIIVQRLGLDQAVQPALEQLVPVELPPLPEGSTAAGATATPESEPEPVASGRP